MLIDTDYLNFTDTNTDYFNFTDTQNFNRYLTDTQPIPKLCPITSNWKNCMPKLCISHPMQKSPLIGKLRVKIIEHVKAFGEPLRSERRPAFRLETTVFYAFFFNIIFLFFL